MQIGFLFAGLLFFCNPNFEIIDLFPDFIGCALILWGIRRLSAVTERGKAAAKDFRLLLGLNLLQALSCLLFFLLAESEMTWMLTLTACFGVAEAVFFCRGMARLDDAVSYSAMEGDFERIYADRQRSSLTGYAIFFGIAKCLFALLPTLTFLVTDYGDVGMIETDWSFLFKLLQGANLVLVTIFGILLAILGCRYCRALGKESAYLRYLDGRYDEEIVRAPGVLTYKRLRLGGTLLFLGMLFLLPLRLDGVDFLPDFVAAALILACALLLKREYPKEARPAILAGGVFALFALGEWVVNLLLLFRSGFSILGEQRLSYAVFLDQYLYHDAGAYNVFLAVCALTVLKSLALCVSLFLLYKIFARIIGEHTGSAEGIRAETVAANTERVRAHLRRFLKALEILTVLAAICAVAAQFLFLQKAPWWLLEFSGAAILAVTGRVFTYSLQTAVDNKYYFSELI